jgi:hypothetical protein
MNATKHILGNKSQDTRCTFDGLAFRTFLTLSLLKIVKKSQAGGGVAVKIEHAVYQSAKMFGRHFDEKDELLSHVTRTSIDVLKVSVQSCYFPW